MPDSSTGGQCKDLETVKRAIARDHPFEKVSMNVFLNDSCESDPMREFDNSHSEDDVTIARQKLDDWKPENDWNWFQYDS